MFKGDLEKSTSAQWLSFDHGQCLSIYSGATGRGDRGRVPPPDIFNRENFGDLQGKEGHLGHLKLEKKKEKKRFGKLKMEGKRFENEQRTFVNYCLYFAFHFLKPLKFVWGLLKKENFYREKALHAGKKIGKSDFAPSYHAYATVFWFTVKINLTCQLLWCPWNVGLSTCT